MTFKEVLKQKLHHDLGFDFCVKRGRPATFQIITRSAGLLAGMIFVPTIAEIAEEEFFLKPLGADPFSPAKVYPHKYDGEYIRPGDILAKFYGDAEVLLKAERTICDILSELSGIATHTLHVVNKVSGTPAVIIDTRKSDALHRPMEKYAVRVGGGENHRMGLYDGRLIKDNDIAVSGGIKKAIDYCFRDLRFLTRVEIEVKNLEELREALGDGRTDAILLDNMSPDLLKEAVELVRGSGKDYLIEASGIGAHDLQEIAKTGVMFISTSQLVTKGKGERLNIAMKAVDT